MKTKKYVSSFSGSGTIGQDSGQYDWWAGSCYSQSRPQLHCSVVAARAEGCWVGSHHSSVGSHCWQTAENHPPASETGAAYQTNWSQCPSQGTIWNVVVVVFFLLFCGLSAAKPGLPYGVMYSPVHTCMDFSRSENFFLASVNTFDVSWSILFKSYLFSVCILQWKKWNSNWSWISRFEKIHASVNRAYVLCPSPWPPWPKTPPWSWDPSDPETLHPTSYDHMTVIMSCDTTKAGAWFVDSAYIYIYTFFWVLVLWATIQTWVFCFTRWGTFQKSFKKLCNNHVSFFFQRTMNGILRVIRMDMKPKVRTICITEKPRCTVGSCGITHELKASWLSTRTNFAECFLRLTQWLVQFVKKNTQQDQRHHDEVIV